MACGCSGGSSGGIGGAPGPLLSGVLHSEVVDSTRSVAAAAAASSPVNAGLAGLDSFSVEHFSGLSFWIVVAAVIAGTWWLDSERRKSE
jgi:hypothetical protein